MMNPMIMSQSTTCPTNQTSKIVVQKNDEALEHFLHGDFDTAIDLLQDAFSVFSSFRYHYYLYLLQSEQHRQQQYDSIHGNFHSHYIQHLRSTILNVVTEQNNVSLIPTPQSFHPSTSWNTRPHHVVEGLRSGHDKATQHSHDRSEHEGHTYYHCQTSSSISSCPSASSLYNRGFILSLDHTHQDDKEDDHDMILLIKNGEQTGAILLYNLGLVYHNIAIHLGVSAAIPYSIRLYQWSLSLLDVRSAEIVSADVKYNDNSTHSQCTSSSSSSCGSGLRNGLRHDSLTTGAARYSNGSERNGKSCIVPRRQHDHPHLQQQERQQQHDDIFRRSNDTKLVLAVLNNLSNLYTSLNAVAETHYTLLRSRMVLAASAVSTMVPPPPSSPPSNRRATTPTRVPSSRTIDSSGNAPSNGNINTGMNGSRNILNSGENLISLDKDYNWFFINALFQAKELNFAPAA